MTKTHIVILRVIVLAMLFCMACPPVLSFDEPIPPPSEQIVTSPEWSCPWKGDAEDVILEPLSDGTLRITIKGGSQDNNKGAIMSIQVAQWVIGDDGKLHAEIASPDGPMDIAVAIRTDEYYESIRQTIDSWESAPVIFDLTTNTYMSGSSDWGHTTSINRKERMESVELVIYPVPNEDRTLLLKPIKLTDVTSPLKAGEREYADLRILSAAPLDVNTAQHELFEIQAKLSTAYTNPFDPAEITVDALFTSPSGETKKCPGFLYAFSQGPGLPDVWRVRFSPDEPGRWKWRLVARTPTAKEKTEINEMECAEGTAKGPLRIAKDNPFYFEHVNGTFFYPIGHNVCWNSPAQYRDQFSKMGDNGENWSRIWLAAWNAEIEWTPRGGMYEGLGKYELAHATKLDDIVREAEDSGIYLQLVLHEHCRLSIYVNSEWANNPYNVDRGGMCKIPLDFLSMEEAKKLAKNRIRYLIARYGYSPNVMAWELFNEADFVHDFNFEMDAAWHQEMAQYIKDTDPHGHMVTTSYIRNPNHLTCALPEIDYTQSHIYAPDLISYLSYVYPFFREFEKPHFLGEFGRNTTDGVDAQDKTGKVLHSAIWTQFMTPDGGSAMSWWWYDQIDPNNLYYHFDALSKYAEGLDRRNTDWSYQTGQFMSDAGPNPHVLGLVSKGLINLWMYDTNFLPWSEGTLPEYPRMIGTLTVTNVTDGTWLAEHWDTYTGDIRRSTKLEAVDGVLAVPIDAKGPDAAFKLKYEGWAKTEPQLALNHWDPRNPPEITQHEFTIRRAMSPVTIDGDLKEWGGTEKHVAQPKDGRTPDDNSFYFSVVHDDTNLYIAVRVTDDAILRKQVPGPDLWQDDCVEFWLDTMFDVGFFNNLPHNPGCYQVNIAPGTSTNEGPINAAYRNPNWNNRVFPHVEMASSILPDGYIIEARFPLDVLRDGKTPEDPNRIGFNISTCDGDPGEGSAKPAWNHLLWKGKHEWNASEWATGILEQEPLTEETNK